VKKKAIQFKNAMGQSNQELYFYGDIVSDEWDKWSDADTCPQDIIDILSQIDESKPLDIYINSGGGSVFAGMAIYNMLMRTKSFKTVHVDGVAGSISSVIAMAGDKIVMPSNSYLMIHHALCGIQGNPIELRKMADTLDKIDVGMLEVYKSKLVDGVDIETIKTMIDNETWMTGDEASKYFNIEVIQSNNAVASISKLDMYNKVPKELKNMTDDNTDCCLCEQCTCTDCKKDTCEEPPNEDVNNELELAIAKLRIRM